MKISSSLKEQIRMLPENPGVYQYFNANEEIIYVGKAKNLKKRVNSYFNKIHDDNKTNVLVKNISYLRYIVVDSEENALLLENNLIKQYQPRYNILLKDGKTYPSICITNEEFPRIFKTRNINKKWGQYFGPFSSGYTINSILEIINKLYPIRSCHLALTEQSIATGKFKVCLDYHIKKCKGPCEAYQTRKEYQDNINEIKKIIQGDANEISKLLFAKMKKLAAEYKFEEANEIKQKYDLIENYKSKSIIANSVVNNTDVFAYAEDENAAYVNILRVSKGAIIQGYTIEYKKRIDETKEDILSIAIIELREKLNSNSKEIIIPFPIEIEFAYIKFIVPRRGDRKKLLELSEQNVKQYKLEKLKQTAKLNPDQKSIQLLTEIQQKLHLEKIPITIEAFDNSNISGSDAVAACVVFKKAKPSKKDYRKYIIKTVQGPDDYASMKEVVKRRYIRMVNENAPLPDLIIADGGIGQMEVIRQVVEDELNLKIPIAGLAKNDKHKTSELLYGFPPKEIGMKPNDTLFKLLAFIQEEVHRFAITFHRDKRSKNQTASELDNIRGIGEKTKNELIKHFKSVKRIKSSNLDELTKIIGTNRASIVYKYFHPVLNA
ncbi:MAG TPA: excinuclease ABC subunit UvrC [Paludibacteraceae bacterium]|nr:excinuclease ABC subunit UvrC [Paludibacteraceae bacterium]